MSVTALRTPRKSPDLYVMIASKGGLPTHPIWYLTLEANPNCELMVGPKAVSARARVAEGEERERARGPRSEHEGHLLLHQSIMHAQGGGML